MTVVSVSVMLTWISWTKYVNLKCQIEKNLSQSYKLFKQEFLQIKIGFIKAYCTFLDNGHHNIFNLICSVRNNKQNIESKVLYYFFFCCIFIERTLNFLAGRSTWSSFAKILSYFVLYLVHKVLLSGLKSYTRFFFCLPIAVKNMMKSEVLSNAWGPIFLHENITSVKLSG